MINVVIKSKIGLHARPAAVFCQEAKKYTSDIVLSKDGKEINGKSLIRIMSAGIEYNDVVSIHATGSDADEAEKALVKLLEKMVD